MSPAIGSRHTLRWMTVFGLVVLAHGGLLALLGPVAKMPEPAGEPAMLIDMAPAPEPEPVKDSTPALADTPPVQQPSSPDSAPSEQAETPPPLVPPDPPIPDTLPPPLPEAVKPPVIMPRHASPVPRPKPMPLPAVRLEQPTPLAQPVATPPPASATTAARFPVSWQTRLLAHLNRYKHYPAEAQMRHRQGTASVHLRLLPNGFVEAVRLQAGSGTDALDQEAIALIGRAQPLPVPDNETGPVEIDVPIAFTIR